MTSSTLDELERDIQAKLAELPAADWVRAMRDSYNRTGTFRPEDLRRLLGHPNKSVEVGPEPCLSSFSTE